VETAYSRRLYPAIAGGLAAVTSRVPFSVAEALAAAVLVAMVGLAVGAIVRRGQRGRRVAFGAATLATAGMVLYLVFLAAWGLNYQRRPLAASIGLRSEPATPGELAAACAELVALAETLRDAVPEREGVGGLARAQLGFEVLAPEWPVLAGPPPVVRAARSSPVLARLGISGIFVPFTGEPHVNVTLPEWTLPFTAAHEVAHQRGFAREDEANYLAFVTGMHHPDPEARYSAAMEASLYTLGALRRRDPQAADGLEARRGAGTRRDLAALEAWRERYVGRVAAVNTRVNDAYLRAQGQADGVQSYGRMVDLILAQRRAAGTLAPTGLPTGPAPR
jgi:uncharacterized protein DUF3810